MTRSHTKLLLIALGLFVGTVGSLSAQQPDSTKADSIRRKAIELDSIVVTAKQPIWWGMLPGLLLERRQITSNVQSASGEEIRKSNALSLTDFMNGQLQSVSVADYSGNQLQADVQFRGFTAGPQIGTPQGLSVFLDGVRVNEPFGDVVNWDMLPLNALAQMDIFPGSNPLFGLNTLGGALVLRTRNGFTDKGVTPRISGASWGRRQAELNAGTSSGSLAGFTALNYFEEDGWRDNSPSKVYQGFGRVDWRSGSVGLTATALLARNDLIGNGLIPLAMFRQRAANIFSSPDQAKNSLTQFTLGGQWTMSATSNVALQFYRRNSDRTGLNGDVNDDFADFHRQNGDVVPDTLRSHALPYCQRVDANGDGRTDVDTLVDPGTGETFTQEVILNGTPGVDCIDPIRDSNGIPRQSEGGSSGVVDGTPIGVLTNTSVGQLSHGVALQFNVNAPQHRFTVGSTFDASNEKYRTSAQLGMLDGTRAAFLDPTGLDSLYRAAQIPIPLNNFDGKSRNLSLFFSETWTPKSNLNFNLGARFNMARVENALRDRIFPGDLSEIKNRNYGRRPLLLCPTRDPASCPDTPEIVFLDPDTFKVSATGTTATYRSFNPSVGMTWSPKPDLNVFGNWSMGTRVPSSIELGCAFDATPVQVGGGGTDSAGNPIPPTYEPRSIISPTCNLPNQLAGDPYLPQIRAYSAEIGARGGFGKHIAWSASAYRIDLHDDIQFVFVNSISSFFQNTGNTRRQGFELGLATRLGPTEFRVNYSGVDATYRTSWWDYSPLNSSAFTDRLVIDSLYPGHGPGDVPTYPNSPRRGVPCVGCTLVDKGARLPGVPTQNLNLNLDVRVLRGLSVGAGMIAHSRTYLRGNENNRHSGTGNDSQAWQWVQQPDGSIQRIQDTTQGRNYAGAGTVPGFAVFNLHGSWRPVAGLIVSAQVNNLFDNKYFTAGRLGVNPFVTASDGVINGPSGWNYSHLQWQPGAFVGPSGPRNVSLAVSYLFGGAPAP